MSRRRPLTDLLVWFAGAAILIATLLAPVLHYFSARNFIAGSLQTEAEELARQVSRVITTNPEMWEFEVERIEAFLDTRPHQAATEIRRVYNSDNEVVAESVEAVKPPYISATHEVMDSGVPVGKLEVVRSLRPLLGSSLLLFLLFAFLGLGAYQVLRHTIARGLGEAEIQSHYYQEKLKEYVRALDKAEETERRYLAMALHDDLGQILSLCKTKLEPTGAAGGDDGEVRDAAGARKLLSLAIVRTRNLMGSLSSHTLDELGLPAAMDELCHTAGREHGFHVNLKKEGEFAGLDPATKGIFFRAARELLTNVAKHAGARNVAVTLRAGDGLLRLTVTDDGRGMDDGRGKELFGSGFGLFSVREHLHSLGGTVEIKSPEVGTRVILEAPLAERKA